MTNIKFADVNITKSDINIKGTDGNDEHDDGEDGDNAQLSVESMNNLTIQSSEIKCIGGKGQNGMDSDSDGGDGGNGGSVIIRATRRLNTLTDFTAHKYFKAPDGKPGRGKNQFGKNGPDLFIDVPLGTIIEDSDTGELLADLIHEKQEFLLLPGGKGGKGNQRFATSVNRAPKIAQTGLPGQERRVRLLLKFITDIGLIGLPNAGKSTLLSRLSMARPKIDSYPFTIFGLSTNAGL